jgi:alpha-tubulin suppressor-like RCC1 family protein
MTISTKTLSASIASCFSTASGIDTVKTVAANDKLSKCDVYPVASLPCPANNIGRMLIDSTNYRYKVSDGTAWVNGDLVKTGTQLWIWGQNNFGQLGDGTTIGKSVPIVLSGINWCCIASPYRNPVAIKTDGTLWTWGCNAQGQLGDGTTISKSSPITTAGGGNTWCALSGVDCHLTAIKTNGTLWTWGGGYGGQLGDGTTVNKSSPVTTAGGGTDWYLVSAGWNGTSAIKTNGTLWTWGKNSNGNLGDNTVVDKSSPVTTSGGGTNWCVTNIVHFATAAIKTDGTLWTWGRGINGSLGDGTTVDKSSPVTVTNGGSIWCKINGAYRSFYAVKTNGTLWTWGVNSNGILGDGTTTNKSSPVTTAGGGTNWKIPGIESAIKADGTLWTWGLNGSGQLGDGTTVNKSSPVNVPGTNWCSVSKTDSTIALRRIG